MVNPKKTEIEYRDFSLDLHRKLGKKGIPLVGQMELTFKCNLSCVHCYLAPERTKTELGFEEVIDILDQVHKEGCLWLSFTGGDPFMRSDFCEIYSHAKRKGFIITILTNGTLITPEIVEFLVQEPPFSIDFTLNGITKKTYESITQVQGSFQKVMEAIKLILDNKLPLKIKTQVTRLNYNEFGKIKAYVEDLGLEFKPDLLLFPRLNGSSKPCSYRLSLEQQLSLDRFYEDKEGCAEDNRTENNINTPDDLFCCAGGVNSFYVNPYGELIFCTFMREPNFDLRKATFKKGFYALYSEIRALKYKSDSLCKNCEISYLCSCCPAMSKLESGDPEKPIRYFCEMAHHIKTEQKNV